jgi:5-formyltetrahydrofolate cyclo-ligase
VSKIELRASIKELLKSMSELERENLSTLLGENLTTYLPRIISNSNVSNVQVLGGFSPIQKEVLWFRSLFVQSQKIAVPHILSESQLKFFEIEIDEIVKDQVGLKLTQVQMNNEVVPDIILVPGLAFDKKLNRLGRGKGFYDRFLKNFAGIKVGVCFEIQLVDEVPIDDHDIELDYLITEKNIYNKGK